MTGQTSLVRRYYDELAPSYDEHEHALFWRIADELLEGLLRRWIPVAPGQWADIGGGTGRWTAWIAQRIGAAPFFVDASPGMVEQAQRRLDTMPEGKGFRPLVAEAESLPFRQELLDGLICLNNVIGLAADPDALLHEVARTLRPEGVAIVSYCRPTPAVLHMMLHGHERAALSLLEGHTCIAPWADHVLRTFDQDEIHRSCTRALLRIEDDVGFPRTIVPHVSVEATLARAGIDVVLAHERRLLGQPGDDLAYTRILRLRRQHRDRSGSCLP